MYICIYTYYVVVCLCIYIPGYIHIYAHESLWCIIYTYIYISYHIIHDTMMYNTKSSRAFPVMFPSKPWNRGVGRSKPCSNSSTPMAVAKSPRRHCSGHALPHRAPQGPCGKGGSLRMVIYMYMLVYVNMG